MAAARQRKVILPPGRGGKKLTFALTPLADAMFQLLIFFMLSSSLAPYSLLTLTPGAQAAASTTPAETSASFPAIWNLSGGTIRVGTVEVPLTRIASLIEDLRETGTDQVIVFAAASARVQDIATVLNQLTLAGVGSVELVSAEGG